MHNSLFSLSGALETRHEERSKATWVVCILLMEPQHAHGQPLAEGGHYGVLEDRYCIQVSPKD